MCIAADAGCHEVPDPIAPIDIKFLSLAPTRIDMSLSVITINGPMLIAPPLPPPMFMPGICDIGLGAGLADGIGMFIPGIFIGACGDAAGVGVAAGICIPGMFISGVGEALGVGEGIGICIFVGGGVGETFGVGVGIGIGIPCLC